MGCAGLVVMGPPSVLRDCAAHTDALGSGFGRFCLPLAWKRSLQVEEEKGFTPIKSA